MKSISLLIFSIITATSMAATSEQMIMVGRHYYRNVDKTGKSYFEKARQEATDAGFKKAYFSDANAQKNYIYSIDLDTLQETGLSFEEFATQQGFTAQSNFIGRRFLFIRFSSHSGITELDIGISMCYGYMSVLEKKAGTDEERIRGVTVKCCL